jgi:c-di-GMP-binding flagellar brake protein YcgR
MVNEHPGVDARRFVRTQAELRVKIAYRRQQHMQLANGRAHDLSEGGLAVYVPLELGVGEQLDLEFTLPRARAPIRVPATVRNRMGFRYGLEFLILSKMQREEIVEFLRHSPSAS